MGRILLDRKLTISVAESCTAGMLGGALTDMPGSSAYFLGGEIVYSNEIKTEMLGIPSHYFERFGAVSQETAELLAENVKAKFESDLGVSITGIAGPDGGSEAKPVGTVWVGVSYKEKTQAVKYSFNSTRKINRERAVYSALGLIYKLLSDKEGIMIEQIYFRHRKLVRRNVLFCRNWRKSNKQRGFDAIIPRKIRRGNS